MARTAARICLYIALLGTAEGASVRDIDWRNHSYPRLAAPAAWGFSQETLVPSFRLKAGMARFRDGLAWAYVRYVSSAFGDLDGDGIDDVAIELHAGTGGTQGLDMIYAFAGPSGRIMSSFGTGDRGNGGIYQVAIDRNRLILDLADPDHMSGLCCSLRVLNQPYVWRRGRFEAATPVMQRRLALDQVSDEEEIERLFAAAPVYRAAREQASCPRLSPLFETDTSVPTRARFELRDRCRATPVIGRFSVELKTGRIFNDSTQSEIDTAEIQAIRRDLFAPVRVR